MPIRVYNSLTRKKEDFVPVKDRLVNIYTCGVTVYDESHIGHARSLFIFDLIRRFFRSSGFRVRFVRNITDIDDKIINRANELKTDWGRLVKKYISSYYRDLAFLGIGKADFEPRATRNIREMISYIKALLDKGYAYESEGDVYFDVRKFSGYGKLSGQSISQMEHGARIGVSEIKRDPLDFALWKKSKPGEPSWRSPWGFGRPGWHIECSVMSRKFLKTDTLDIHAGGRDLIFPHHENEIAQSEALTGRDFAKYWIHHGLLTISAQKMSKSLGNFITIKDFAGRYKDPDLLKLFFLSAHYAHPIDYNEEKIIESAKQKQGYVEFFERSESWFLSGAKREEEFTKEEKEKIDNIRRKFYEVMEDDFNTPQALACLFELVALGSRFISADKANAFSYTKNILTEFLKILGLSVPAKFRLTAELKKKIREMGLMRSNKDFDRADNIRDFLKSRGYTASNTAGGVTVSRVRNNL